MPFSSENGKPQIRKIMERLKPSTMLDVGCGSGTYAKMFPDVSKTGIEIWEPYIEQYGLKDLYNNLITADIRTWEPTRTYDVAILGDILEHMTVEEAKAVFEKIKGCSTSVIVSIPIGHYPQDEYEGNPHEAHVVDHWTDEMVKDTFGKPTWGQIDNEIGIYVWSPINVRPKICVYAISKNEAHFIPRFCESAKPADLVLIADTGSTDGLPEEAEKYGAQVHHISITPWRFDLARNAALALIPRDYDICISLDIDEVLQEGWREEIERVWMWGKTTRLRYMFDWGSGIAFYYEKIHGKNGYMWHHPCHEYPIVDGRVTEVWAQTDKLIAVHKPDPTKSRSQYLDLLELSVKEDPDCPRNAFYYARELSFHERWRESIEACEKYLKLPRATWPNERCYAYRVMGRCHAMVRDFVNAEKAFQLAAAEAPNTREPWCELAKLMYLQNRWEESFAYAMRALRITDRAMVYTCDPEVWGYQAHDYASIAAWHLGLKNISIEQAQLALAFEPDNVRLKANLDLVSGT